MAMRTKEGVYLVDRHTTTAQQQKDSKVISKHSSFMAYNASGSRLLALGSHELQVIDTSTHAIVGSMHFSQAIMD